MLIRDAVPQDWPGIWRILQPLTVAGETLTADPETTAERSRPGWMDKRGGRVFVAVEGDEIVGSANLHPNHGGPGSHVANAGFIVDPSHQGKGIGRALAEHVLDQARLAGYQAMQFNAVVATNSRA